ncbi:unnamed protein product, partial [Timema podura]|nr:unnamed protein product [Timema podura]
MVCFLKPMAFFGVAFDNLFNAPHSWKEELHNALQEGIKSGLLQPFERLVLPKEKGSSATDCLDLIEWLVERKANKITLALLPQQNDDTYLHNLDVASRSLDSLSHFVSLIDKSGEDISESRIKADLPILNVQWSHGIKVSNYEGLENLLPSNLQELEGVGFDFLSKTKSPLLLVPSLSSGIGYAPEVLPIFIVPGIKDSIKTFIEPLAKNILYPTICIDLQDHIVSLQDSATNIVQHSDMLASMRSKCVSSFWQDKLVPFSLTYPEDQSCGELRASNCSSQPLKATSKPAISDS